MTLSVSTFFKYYIFHPELAPSKGDRVIAMITTIALGFLTFGITHLICYAGFYHNFKNRNLTIKEENTDENRKVTRVYEEIIDSNEETTTLPTPDKKKIETYYQPQPIWVEHELYSEDLFSEGDESALEVVELHEKSLYPMDVEQEPDVIPMDIDEYSYSSGEEEVMHEEVIKVVEEKIEVQEAPKPKVDTEKQIILKDPIFSEYLDDIKVNAEGGKIDYQHALGCLYLLGEKGLKKSKMKAKFWFRRAAEAKHHKSMYQLAKIYYDSREKDPKLLNDAEEWFRKGSEFDPRAAYWLAKFYEEGIVVEKSQEKANELYSQAKQAGFKHFNN